MPWICWINICDRLKWVVCNINVGHALPRCIIPFGVDAVVDAQRQLICFDELSWDR